MKKFSEWLVERRDSDIFSDLGLSKSGMQIKNPDEELGRGLDSLDRINPNTPDESGDSQQSDIEELASALRRKAGVPRNAAAWAAKKIINGDHFDTERILQAAENPDEARNIINNYYSPSGRNDFN